MEKQLKQISKFLSLVLRHNPQYIGLTLDEQGWARVDELINLINKKGSSLDFATLQIIVDTNDKKRFAFNDDKTMIRASQGHSVKIELNYTAHIPPVMLYHGTSEKDLEAIKQNGIRKMNRHHVHLSHEKETAQKVGQRHGKPVVLCIQALAMHKDGHAFYLSDNGVWLTDHVPVEFIEF